MGLFPEANLVWVVCDKVLFLWRHASACSGGDDRGGGGRGYESDAAAGSAASWGGVPSLPRKVLSEDLCSFTVPSGQCIVGVGLVRPKKGEFVSSLDGGHFCTNCLWLLFQSSVLLETLVTAFFIGVHLFRFILTRQCQWKKHSTTLCSR